MTRWRDGAVFLTAVMVAFLIGLSGPGGWGERIVDLRHAAWNGVGDDPVLWRLADASALPGDEGLAESVRVYPTFFLRVRLWLNRLVGSGVSTWILYTFLNVLSVGGLWVLYRTTLEPISGMLATVVAVGLPFPSVTWASRWGAVPLDWLGYHGFSLALAPWLLWGIWRASESRWWPAAMVGIGAASRADPSAVSLTMAAGLGGVLGIGGARAFRRVLFGGVLFTLMWIVAAHPWLSRGLEPDLESLRLLQSQSISLKSPGGAADVLAHMAWPVVCGLAGFFLAGAEMRKGMRSLCGAGLIGLLCVGIALWMTWVPALIPLQLHRMARYVYAWSAAAVASGAVALWRCGSGRARVGAALLLILAWLPVVRWVAKMRAHIPAPPVAAPHSWSASGFPSGDLPALMHLGLWARRMTPSDATFLVPPDGGELFRLQARRGIFVCRDDGLSAHYDQQFGKRWRGRYLAAREVYAGGESEILALARRVGCRFIVTGDGPPVASLSPIFQNRRYRVYRVPATI